MGGSQALQVAFDHLDQYSAIGVFSSGLLPGFGGPAEAWEAAHLSTLENPMLKRGLKTLRFSTGADDSLLPVSRATVALLQKHGFPATFSAKYWSSYMGQLARLPLSAGTTTLSVRSDTGKTFPWACA